jgi:hypothetical protein
MDVIVELAVPRSAEVRRREHTASPELRALLRRRREHLGPKLRPLCVIEHWMQLTALNHGCQSFRIRLARSRHRLGTPSKFMFDVHAIPPSSTFIPGRILPRPQSSASGRFLPVVAFCTRRAAPRRAWPGLAAAPDGRPWRPATKAQWRVDGRTVSFRTQIRPCTPPDRHHSGVCAPCAGIGDTAWRQAPWARQSRVVDAGAHCGPNAGRAARTGKSAPGSWAWAVGCRKLQWPSRRSAMRSAIAYRFFATDSL